LYLLAKLQQICRQKLCLGSVTGLSLTSAPFLRLAGSIAPPAFVFPL
jgi:hypothetical protein